MFLVMHVVNMCSCAADVYVVHLCTQMCLVVHVVHVCVFGASLHTNVFSGACMCKWGIYMHLYLVVHVVHMCACMCIWCIFAHICVWWCMYVYMVHINASVIADACGAHAF